MQAMFDALVIGAGPAGSACATLLARAGWSVALVERQRFPRRKVCGECIAASNLPLLEALGLGPTIAAVAGPELRRVALWRGDAEVSAALPAADAGRHPWGRALGRETLDALLLERAQAAGVCVLQPWAVRTVEFDGDVAHCRLRAGESQARIDLQARIVVAAHGSWQRSPLEHAAPQPRQASELLCFKANFRGASLADGLLPVLAFDGGYGGVVKADGGITTLACCVRRDALDAARRSGPDAGAGQAVEALLRRSCARLDAVLGRASRDGPWLAGGPLRPGIRVDADEPFFRIGNAAGEAHPIIGEGMSMALQSAFALCEQLTHGDSAALHDRRARRDARLRHARRWRDAFGPRLRLAALFAHAAMRPLGSAALLAMLRGWPGLLTRGAQWGGKVRCAVDASRFRLPAGLPAPYPPPTMATKADE